MKLPYLAGRCSELRPFDREPIDPHGEARRTLGCEDATRSDELRERAQAEIDPVCEEIVVDPRLQWFRSRHQWAPSELSLADPAKLEALSDSELKRVETNLVPAEDQGSGQ